MRTKRIRTALRTGGLLLLAAALCLTGYNLWDGYRASRASAQAVRELERRIPPAADAAPPAEEPEAAPPAYVLDPEMAMPEVVVDGYAYIGYLDIPALELHLPVIDWWSYPGLRRAPCRYAGSAYLGNLVIAAHNYDQHFGRLSRLSGGEEVRFTDAAGNVFSYAVARLEQMEPTAMEEMVSGGWDLSLFTCTPGGKYRVTVRCTAADGGADTAGESGEPAA